MSKCVFVAAASCLVLLSSCAPHLTAEQRRGDVAEMARWARDYHPCSEVNSRIAHLPDYEQLLPKYMDLAERAQTNEEFFQVVWGYFRLLGSSGHGYLLDEQMLSSYMWDSLATGARGLSNIAWGRFNEAKYWAKVQARCFAHPPFRIVRKGERYLIDEDWSYHGKHIPADSQIVAVNGMSCSQFKDHLKRETALRYAACGVDELAAPLLVVSEGPDFKGWSVTFQLPEGGTCESFVPKREGFAPFYDSRFNDPFEDNCVCIELTDEVGYIRIKAMMHPRIKSDSREIRRFLDRSAGRYKTLIIDIRHNGGGSTFYVYDTLIRPFLDEPLVYKQTTGVKRRLLTDFGDEYVDALRSSVSRWAWDTAIDEVQPPEGFDPNQWVFYEISRRVMPSQRYAFDGDLYVLMDRDSGSATETYVDALKRTGFATLVGQRSAGALGGYMMAPVMRLSESGMIFRMEGDLDLNADGSLVELTGVHPDVELPSCQLPERVDKDLLLEDPWIQAVIGGLADSR